LGSLSTSPPHHPPSLERFECKQVLADPSILATFAILYLYNANNSSLSGDFAQQFKAFAMYTNTHAHTHTHTDIHIHVYAYTYYSINKASATGHH
jgi:hypothetical protein